MSVNEILLQFWDSAILIGDDDCRKQWDRVASNFVRTDMIKRFHKDLGGRKPIGSRFFDSSSKISRSDSISSLWPNERVDSVVATVVFGTYERNHGFRVTGLPRDFSCLFIQEEGDATAEIVFGNYQKTLFLTQLTELLVLNQCS